MRSLSPTSFETVIDFRRFSERDTGLESVTNMADLSESFLDPSLFSKVSKKRIRFDDDEVEPSYLSERFGRYIQNRLNFLKKDYKWLAEELIVSPMVIKRYISGRELPNDSLVRLIYIAFGDSKKNVTDVLVERVPKTYFSIITYFIMPI